MWNKYLLSRNEDRSEPYLKVKARDGDRSLYAEDFVIIRKPSTYVYLWSVTRKD